MTNQFKNNVMSIYLMWNSFTTFMMTKGLQKMINIATVTVKKH